MQDSFSRPYCPQLKSVGLVLGVSEMVPGEHLENQHPAIQRVAITVFICCCLSIALDLCVLLLLPAHV